VAPRTFLRRRPALVIGLLIASLPLAVLAQEQLIYRSVDKNGRVTFSDSPPPQARFVETISVPTGPMFTNVPEARQEQRDAARQQLQGDANARATGLIDATAQIRAAYANLQAAKAAQVAGKEPLPGERVGTASGFSRLREEYWDRQRKLQTAVDDAQAEVEAAIRRRNQFR
jgi:hypothetical protein